jgi:hypothetical protein
VDLFIRGESRWMPGAVGFENLEAVHQGVVVGVGEDGGVFDVVEVLVVADLFAELVDLLVGGGCGGHGIQYMRVGGGIRGL